ncbi:MAG: hypothetical protein ABR604_04285 [Jatrophihabitantaceae bacterium]
MTRNFYMSLGLGLVALAAGVQGLREGGGDLWFGVLCLCAVPFFLFAMTRELRRR